MKKTLAQIQAYIAALADSGVAAEQIQAKVKAYVGDAQVVDADGNAIELETIVTRAIAPPAPVAEAVDAAAIAKIVGAAVSEGFAQVAKKLDGRQNPAASITGGENRNDDEKTFGFKSMSEQLRAIQKAATNPGKIDPRLQTKAIQGLNESTDSAGGFLLAPEYADGVREIMHEEQNLLDMTDGGDIAGPSIKLNAIDETSRATGSRRGGVRGYWVAEGDTITKSKPKLRQMTLAPHKLAVLVYTTEELLADGGTMLETISARGAAEEINFLTGDSIFNGIGGFQPQGILNANCLISVAKETGQAAATLVAENIVKMFARLHRSARKNAAWFINQDIEPQLHLLNVPVGTGGALVYMPPGGLSGQPYGTLYGRPIVVTEFNSTLGTQGDIILGDLKHYVTVTRGAIKSSMSQHVEFLTDQLAFKWTFRVDGQPWWNAALTPFKGTVTQGPFITLDTRS